MEPDDTRTRAGASKRIAISVPNVGLGSLQTLESRGNLVDRSRNVNKRGEHPEQCGFGTIDAGSGR